MDTPRSDEELIIGGCLWGIVTYALYRLCKRALKALTNEEDYPPDIGMYHHPFGAKLKAACHITAEGVFSLLTGISASNLDVLGYSHGRYDFDQLPSKELVMYQFFVWDESGVRGPTSLCHGLVYYDGHLYQSYRTQRYWWLPIVYDAYPLIRIKLDKKDIPMFSDDTRLFKVADFNRLCAPSGHPIPLDAKLRSTTTHRARVCPTRREITLTRDLEKDE